ncbi:hypothetical protein ILUMI_18414 [Ignelater luminosus]|uniref:DDE Tnp4 domain-containing protein n=1 Tax=Ignelater luminosus TaxID=2038154 RepID=A0A8K0G0X4_IGNLU|nr:hypothetical protein ILUMI_18414 [Ignelater luminosus]
MADAFVMEYLLDNAIDSNIIYGGVNELEPNVIDLPERRPEIYNEEYVGNIVPNYSISEFKCHSRMARNDVVALCALIAPHMEERHVFISLEKKVFYLASVKARELFGLQWLTINCCNSPGLPGVVGAIIIKQPVNNAVDFYNRNNQHSIILQGVCDDHKIFTVVFIGMPGRVHDARVFQNSRLFEQLTGNPALLPPKQHLIGVAAYPLMKPFRENVIERAFGLLKGKWRRLKYLR